MALQRGLGISIADLGKVVCTANCGISQNSMRPFATSTRPTASREYYFRGVAGEVAPTMLINAQPVGPDHSPATMR